MQIIGGRQAKRLSPQRNKAHQGAPGWGMHLIKAACLRDGRLRACRDRCPLLWPSAVAVKPGHRSVCAWTVRKVRKRTWLQGQEEPAFCEDEWSLSTA